MRESSTYQGILEEGALNQARKMVLQLGQKHFGPASADVVTAVQGIDDLERLERFHNGCSEVSSWQELLQLP